MASITLKDVAHSYRGESQNPDDFALKKLNLTWRDGGAYALLGPSGCGKTTLLNIISGLLIPTRGQVLFKDQDVTRLPTEQRNIAQIFQFPVIYDTMTVFENLAFPLKNRGRTIKEIEPRVIELAGSGSAEFTDTAIWAGNRGRQFNSNANYAQNGDRIFHLSGSSALSLSGCSLTTEQRDTAGDQT